MNKSTKTTHPILLKGPMVRAVLEGRQTQHRVPVRPQPAWVASPAVAFKTSDADPKGIIKCPFGQHGHTLWVRENFRVGACDSLFFQADEEWHEKAKWRPSIHMPRWASRIDLLVKRVWVERVQDISEADAIAEGVVCPKLGTNGMKPETLFKDLWNSIYGKKPDCSWEDNPWVWAVDFEIKEASHE